MLVNAKDNKWFSVLSESVFENRPEITKYLLERYKGVIDINTKDFIGNTPLVIATKYQYWKCAEVLVINGADINTIGTDEFDYTYKYWPFNRVCQYAGEHLVKLMLEFGANINVRDSDGFNPILLASWSGNTEAVKALLLKGANPNDQVYGSLHTPLILASKYGHDSVVYWLMKAGANPDLKNTFGETAGMFASDAQSLKITKYLCGDFTPFTMGI